MTRITQREKYKTFFNTSKTLYGRTVKGEPYIYDLRCDRCFKVYGNFVMNRMGWFVIRPTGFNYWAITTFRLHPIYNVIEEGDKFSLTEERSINYTNIITEYSDLNITSLFKIIGVGFNGMLYKNGELDLSQDYLNTLRRKFDPDFNLSIAKLSTIENYWKMKENINN